MILFLLIAAYAVTFGVMNDKAPLIPYMREWCYFDEMFDCAYCTGFHAGWIVLLASHLAGLYPSESIGERSFAGLLLWCLVSAIFCYILDVLLQRIEGN